MLKSRHDQGQLFAYLRVKVAIHEELAVLVKEPWLVDIRLTRDDEVVHPSQNRGRSGHLTLNIDYVGRPMVTVSNTKHPCETDMLFRATVGRSGSIGKLG